MKKCSVYLIAAVMASLLIFVSAYSQEDMTIVENDVFDNPQRVPSLFKHDDHNDAAGIDACNECHHIYEDGKKLDDSSEDQSCSECHEKETSGNMPALMKAFHMNCKGCHLKKSQGPIMCGECHVK